ncbi:methylase [Cryptosporidium ryanae]|uniref:methylase n=1 Tax=Cryptosporidium ryanae TaxID=515981 RepID=UPI00351A7335|nr:methylase [Cryptosporidium ryanae]
MGDRVVEYGTPEYWEERYEKDPNPYDWYQRWDSIREIVKDYLKLDDKILVIGNGTSRIPEEIYDDGFQNVQAMDISNVAVGYMHERFASRDIKCQVSDVLDMYQYGDDEFDVVFDKGTFDTILCTKNSGINIDKMMKEIIRILNYNKGRYICVSYGQPSYRTTYMKSMKEWDINVIPIKKPGTDQIYNIKNHNETESKGNVEYSKLERPDLYHFIYVCTLFNKPGKTNNKYSDSTTELNERNNLAEQIIDENLGDNTSENFETNEESIDTHNFNEDFNTKTNAEDINNPINCIDHDESDKNSDFNENDMGNIA